MPSSIGPKFFCRVQAPVEWNEQPLSSTQVYLRCEDEPACVVEIYAASFREQLKAGTWADIYIAQVIQESGETLYAFEKLAQRQLFIALMQIKGVNVNVAAAACTQLSASILWGLLDGEKPKGIKIPGLGPKTLEKLAYELKGRKKKFLPLVTRLHAKKTGEGNTTESSGEEVSALIVQSLERLGIRASEIREIHQTLCREKTGFAAMDDQKKLPIILQKWGQLKNHRLRAEETL